MIIIVYLYAGLAKINSDWLIHLPTPQCQILDLQQGQEIEGRYQHLAFFSFPLPPSPVQNKMIEIED